MARSFTSYQRLDEVGIRLDVPPGGRKWTDVQGVYYRGNIRKRGRFKKAGSAGSIATPFGALITEFIHPIPRVRESVVRPISVGNYNAWTATGAPTNWEALDETAPNNDTDYITSAVVDGASSVNLGLPSTFASIKHVALTVVGSATPDAGWVDVFHRQSSTDSTVGAFVIPLVPISQSEALTATAFSVNTWTVVGATAVVALNDTSDSTYFKPPTGATAADSTFTVLASALTWATISKITFKVRLSADVSGTTFTVKLSLKTGSGSTVVLGSLSTTSTTPGDKDITLDGSNNPSTGLAWTAADLAVITNQVDWTSTGRGKFHKFSITVTGTKTAGGGYTSKTFIMTTNPRTAVAWTPTDVSAMEFGVKSKDTNTKRVTLLSARVQGIAGSGRERSKLLVSSAGFFRMKEDFTGFEDVRGAAPLSTALLGSRWDGAELLNKVYFVNGTDPIYDYPLSTSSDLFEQVSTALPRGGTIAAFNSRLVLGDVTESNTRVPYRIRWSAPGAPTDFSGAGSGNMDVTDTPGRVVKLLPLVERGETFIGSLVGYKSTGIYHFQATGDSQVFSKTIMAASLGLIAQATVVAYLNAEGEEVHAFLGHEGGRINVFEWSGRGLRRIGDAIMPSILDNATMELLVNSFAFMDAENGRYILSIAQKDEDFPTFGWAYDISRRIWSRVPLAPITTGGIWDTEGQPTTYVHATDGFAYSFSYDITKDGVSTNPVPEVIETGDIALGAEGTRSTLYRVWLQYIAHDVARVVVSVSGDSGGSFPASQTIYLSGRNDGSLNYIPADVVLESAKHRVRIESSDQDEELELTGLVFEWEPAGPVTPQ